MGFLRFSRLTSAGALVLAACATAPPPAPPAAAAPPDTRPTIVAPAVDPRLTPPDAALRAARSMVPTGLELGTMWTFENPPLHYWRERYGFAPEPSWLERVRLASLRYGQGCSASFVSPDGLVATNHHCARECVESVSTPQQDLLETGFYATTRGAEKLCPELYLDQLIEIRDVTQRVRAAAPSDAASQQVAEAHAAESARIERECAHGTGRTCQVVPLYQGGQYQLYTYRRYGSVKLVFAPELQAGFFGGDPDNFTYPRYALDVSFVRAYETDGTTPARTPQHLRWRAEGAAEGEVVFVTGSPGSTSRLITLSQLLYERSYRHPFVVALLERQRGMLQSIAALGPEQERDVRASLFSVENSLKAYRGQLSGLLDTLLVAQKIAWERDFRARVTASEQVREYADVWERVAHIQLRKLELNPVLNLSSPALVGAQHLVLAAQLAGWLRAAALPEAERAAPYRGDGLARVRTALESTAAMAETQAVARLELQLELIQAWVPPDHPLTRALLEPGETPAAAARRLARASRITDPAWRQSILAGAQTAEDADPLLRVGFVLDSVYHAVLPQWRALAAEEAIQNARLARALFAVYGTQVPPDATFTPRISDGLIARYPYNGTVAPPKTTFYGLYARSAEFDNQMPWRLPPSFERARLRIDLHMPLNFVSTNDITGGNSGSPIIDRDGRVVGIAFDGNIEQLPNEFVFDPTVGRTVSVHAAGIIEALRTVYQAQALVDELLGGRR